MNKKQKYILVQDDCDPNSFEVFEKELKEITGYDTHSFSSCGDITESDDGLHIEYKLGFWVLEYDGDDPYYKLRRLKFSTVVENSIHQCYHAFMEGKPIFSYVINGSTLICKKVYVKKIEDCYFLDTNGNPNSYKLMWHVRKTVAFNLFSEEIENQFSVEKGKI